MTKDDIKKVDDALTQTDDKKDDLQDSIDTLVDNVEQSNDLDKDNQTELIDTLTDLKKSIDKSNELDTKSQKSINDNLEQLDQSINKLELDPTINYNVDGLDSQLQQLIDLLTPINQALDTFTIACGAIISYSVYYIPLAVVVFCLWWFFKQFLR